ncbi:MAG: LysM peptidoglycan-binding domain-containing protein [Bacteroidetes bacterium]|nr:LysM peptidoglycan-binding domain-containing protein [Bacteroidota bacterium]
MQPGDTLWNIAQRYQSDINKIKKLNNINNSKNLRSGTRIKVPLNGG